MTLAAQEFIRRFLLHALPDGFHRIRHYGFLANGRRTAKRALCRTLLQAQPPRVVAAAQAAPPRLPLRHLMTPSSTDILTPIPPAASRAGAAAVAPRAARPPDTGRHNGCDPSQPPLQLLLADGDAAAVTVRNAQIRTGIGVSGPPPRPLSP